MTRDELRTALADLAHDVWAHSIQHVEDMGSVIRTKEGDYSLTLGSSILTRWERQARTRLADLPPGEADSAFEAADRYLALVDSYAGAALYELELRRDDGAAMLRESLERARALALLEAEARLLQGIEADCREYVARLTAQIEQLGAVPVLPDDYERNAAPRDDAGK